MEWTDEKVNKLIELYERNMCLYDVASSEYHSEYLNLIPGRQV